MASPPSIATYARTNLLSRDPAIRPSAVPKLLARWFLTLDSGIEYQGSVSWVAPVLRADRTAAVLKIGVPHMEAEHEIQGLRFWEGDPTVQLLEADEKPNAMLLERCVPGTSLGELPEEEQDVVIAGLLRRLWRAVPTPHPFRPLSAMIEYWSQETLANLSRWTDPGLVKEGLAAFADLAEPGSADVLLATDLHAGNVLRAEREPWLVIDPKPFVGDPAYDATQHLFNCRERLLTKPDETIARFADLLGVDAERVRRWTFARAAAEPREDREEMSHLAWLLRG